MLLKGITVCEWDACACAARVCMWGGVTVEGVVRVGYVKVFGGNGGILQS